MKQFSKLKRKNKNELEEQATRVFAVGANFPGTVDKFNGMNIINF